MGHFPKTYGESSPLFSQGSAAKVQDQLVQGVWLLLFHFFLFLLLLPSFLREGVGLGKGLPESPPVSPIAPMGWVFLSHMFHILHPSLFLPKPEATFLIPLHVKGDPWRCTTGSLSPALSSSAPTLPGRPKLTERSSIMRSSKLWSSVRIHVALYLSRNMLLARCLQ